MAASSILAEPSLKEMGLQEEDLRLLLQEQGWQPVAEGPYFRCGDGWERPGWHLHVAVTRSCFKQLIEEVLPLLSKTGVSICLFRDYLLGNVMVNGGFGIRLQGKALSILSVQGQQASDLAGLLVSATSMMKGPDVPGAYHLGARVYVEYVRQQGKSNFDTGEGGKGLLRFFQEFEFVLPRGVGWPFDKVAAYHPPKKQLLLQGRYLFVDMLKADAKGHVMQALQLRWGIPTRCVIKEGLAGINEDEAGRDATDSIRWQAHVAGRVKGHVRTPDVLACFKFGRKAYLVTRWVPSTELSAVLEQILQGRCWQDLDINDRLRIRQYLAKVLSILSGFHELGIVHRDVTPFNFRVDAMDMVWVFDLEQSHDRLRNQPAPPFGGGTPGYKPEVESIDSLLGPGDDIYGFGGLMLFASTGLFAHHFMGIGDKSKAILFLTQDRCLVGLITNCRATDPAERPVTDYLSAAINVLPGKKIPEFPTENHLLTKSELTTVVTDCLAGLHHPAMLTVDGYWKADSKGQEIVYSGQWSSEASCPGLYNGVGGVLLTIFRAMKCGLRWPVISSQLNKNISYLVAQLGPDQRGDVGLMNGAAGMRIVIAEGVKTGIFQGHEQQMLRLLSDDNAGVDVSGVVDLSFDKGLAGQMVALLVTGSEEWLFAGSKIAQRIGELQRPDGGWKYSDHRFSAGLPGIIWSLLVFLQFTGDTVTRDTIEKALRRLTSEIFKRNGRLRETANPWLEGSAGQALTYLKAYEVLGDGKHLDIAKQILLEYPERITSNRLTAGDGLAGLGEVYLYAWRVTNDNTWLQRAGWIAQLLGHLFYRPQEGVGWWMTGRSGEPSASLFSGSSGPLSFLLHYLHPDQSVGLIPGA